MDVFTGVWRLRPELSSLGAAAPESWVQEILVDDGFVEVRERIVRGGQETLVHATARLDSGDYEVSGSPVVDTIAYERLDGVSISGTGKKQGQVVLRETVRMKDGRLRMEFRIGPDGGPAREGVAIFNRD